MSVVAVIAVLVVLAALLAMRTATRLDRLYIRTDAAWAALDGLLARRTALARALVGMPRSLHAAAERTRTAGQTSGSVSGEREAAENELSAALAALDRVSLEPLVAAELADVEQRVVIARRVHADAVRDTQALRRRRAVRWLHLAGTAPWPRFFEIAEPRDEPAALPVRPSARLVLADRDDRVLLFRFADPRGPFWCTPGGGLEPGEDLRAAVARELAEETGTLVAPAALTGPVWFRRAVFPLGGCDVEGREWFFLLRVDGAGGVDVPVDTTGFTALETATVLGHRWWHPTDLAATGDTVYPADLARLLPPLLSAPWDGRTRRIT